MEQSRIFLSSNNGARAQAIGTMMLISAWSLCLILFQMDHARAQALTGRGTIGDSGTVERMRLQLEQLSILVDTQIETLTRRIADMERCNSSRKFFDPASSSCLDELDPLAQPFAKELLPQCASGEYLTGNGGRLLCKRLPAFEEGKPYEVSCTSKAGRSQTVRGNGAGEVLVARAPSNQSTWVIYPNGPYLNCFDGPSQELDFQQMDGCKTFAGTPGHGRYLANCRW